MTDRGFRYFEQVTVLVARGGIEAGEIAAVSRIYGDGSVELEIIERNDPPTQVFLGILANRPPYTRRVQARFAADEVQRRG